MQSLQTRLRKSTGMREALAKKRGDAPLLHPKKKRYDVQHRLWREAVLERDAYQCQCCGAREDLVAHHVVPYDEAPELRYVVQNGMTLCRACHPKQHSGWKHTQEARKKMSDAVKAARQREREAKEPKVTWPEDPADRAPKYHEPSQPATKIEKKKGKGKKK